MSNVAESPCEALVASLGIAMPIATQTLSSGLGAVLAGASDRFDLNYPYQADGAQHWFSVTVVTTWVLLLDELLNQYWMSESTWV